MKHIVILGGGFAGVAAGLKLLKELPKHEATITLVDRNPYHLFTPSLYEVATSEEPQKNITIPFSKLFPKRVTHLKDKVEIIDAEKKVVILKEQGELPFDYLIIALGSEPAYYNIPGLKEYSIPFKWLPNAVLMKNKIKSMCCKEGECHRKVPLVIGGGGFAGTELAEELLTYKDKIARENNLDKNCLEVTVIQGSDRVLKELDPHVSSIATKRLTNPNVKLAFGGHITKVDEQNVYTDDGKVIPYEIFIWTGGVEGNNIAKKSELPVNKRGQIPVNNYLQMENHPNIFVTGDLAGYTDPKSNELVPNVAQVAEEQGSTAAENVVRLIKNQPLTPYKYRHFGYVVPLRGRYAVAELMWGIHLDGMLGWMLQQVVFLRYLLGILPLPLALKRWNDFEMHLEQS